MASCRFSDSTFMIYLMFSNILIYLFCFFRPKNGIMLNLASGVDLSNFVRDNIFDKKKPGNSSAGQL